MLLARFRNTLRSLLRRDGFEDAMDAEMRFHLESRTADLVARGMRQRDAARAARLEFGSVEKQKDLARASAGLRLFDDLRADVRFALRAMGRDALVTLTIVATLSLGIGATAAMFTAVNAALLRPLPFPDPDRLMMLFSGPSEPTPSFGPDFEEWHAGCGACAGMAAFHQWETTVSGGAEPERVLAARVTPDFFATLGVQPMLGRSFLRSEQGRGMLGNTEQPVANAAVILGASLWRRQFHADPAVIGRTIKIEGDPSLVVGVMPDGFAFPDRAEAWAPAVVSTTRGNLYLKVLARLKPGVSPAQADAEFKTLIARLQAQAPNDRRADAVHLQPLQEYLVGDVRTSLAIFFAAVGLVLLIACANVANLLLAQAATRPREMAIRTILGAGRRRLMRQLLTESLLLAAGGGAGGLVFAAWMLAIFRSTLPEAVPRLNAIAIDWPVVGFVAAVSFGAGLLFGLAPAWRSARPDLNAALKDGATRGTGGAHRRRVRGVLVVSEVSFAMVLLIGAGLLVRSLVLLRTRPLGFVPDGVVTATVTMPDRDYPESPQVKAFFAEALARVQGRPGIDDAGAISALPLSRHGARVRGDAKVDGESTERKGALPAKLAVGGNYFKAMGITLLRGRLLDARDTADAPAVVVVSQSFANRLWPSQNPLGRRVGTGFGNAPWAEVVGVVADVKQDGLRQNTSQAVYHPFPQVSDRARWLIGEMTFVLRSSSLSPFTAVSTLRGVLREMDRNVPLYAVVPMRDVVANNASDPRFYALLMGALSLLAFVLAVSGLYGVVSYSARQRTHELGVRVALGARRIDIASLILREALVLVGIGTVLGVAGSYAATRLLARFLFQVTATDPSTFVAVPAFLCVVSLAACYVPASRATTVDPLYALKYE
jgi:putative ABC transport system permease protein